jgi:hypothetical protein
MWRWVFMLIPLGLLLVVGLALAEAILLEASWVVLVGLALGALGGLALAGFSAVIIGTTIGTAVRK